MDILDLSHLVDELIAEAKSATSGRSSRTIFGGHEHALRQTVIALSGGRALDEHESPGEATLQVLRGNIRLHAADESWDGSVGEYVVIPPTRHGVEAVEDSAFLLTVAVPRGKE
jgi:quercetin dioxygenase-like cupin family protein